NGQMSLDCIGFRRRDGCRLRITSCSQCSFFPLFLACLLACHCHRSCFGLLTKGLALHTAAAVLAPSKGCRIAPTCTCVHVPARPVRSLGWLGLAAMALWLVMPLRMISSMMGRTLAANRLALAFRAALPRFATSAMSGLPRRFPRRLAAARASLVRFEI